MAAHMTMRERQRLETLTALHRSATALVREGGLAAATIDAITAQTGIARRTFFNYYASKEDAILGTTAPMVPEEAMAQFLESESGTDEFTRTITLIGAVMRSTREAEVDVGEIRRLLAEFPELSARQQQHSAAAEKLVESAISTHIPDSSEAPARALVLLATSVLRYAYSIDPVSIPTADSPVVQVAIDTFRTILDRVGRP
ncbi:TetR/AcrR family transcriptional regulator [Gordonia sp. VNK21]|uniref:TetR/AcrR family transcriptional regulator n=1 Tax=Gordonia sp. VNK21 TaxID=3382483 RepID=UPI0038D4E45E